MFYSAVRIIRTVSRIFNRISHYFVQWICDYLDDFLEELISKYDTTAISKTLDNHQKDDLKSRNSEKYKKSDVLCNGSFYTKAEYFKTVATYSERNKSVEGDSIRIESLNATDYEVLNSEMHISNLNICFHGSDTSKLNNVKTVTLPYKFSRVNIEIISGDCIQNKASNSTNNGIESEEKTSVKLEPRTCVTICNSDINKEFPNGNKITESDINNSRAGGKETDIINSSNLSSYNNIPLKSDVLEPETVNHTTDISKTIAVKNHDENLKSVDSEKEIPYGSFFQENQQLFDNFSFVNMELENSGETVQEMGKFALLPYENHLNTCNASFESTCCLPTKENTECLKNETTLASQMNESPKMPPNGGKKISKDLDALKLTTDNQQNNYNIFQENRDLMEDMIGDTQVRNGYDRRCNLKMSHESQVNNNDVEAKDLLCTTAVQSDTKNTCDSETRASTPNYDFEESSYKIVMTAPTESSKEKCEYPEIQIASSSEDMNIKSCKLLSSVQHDWEKDTDHLRTLNDESIKKDSRVPLETSARNADELETTNHYGATGKSSFELFTPEKCANDPNSDRYSNSKSCPSGALNQHMKYHGQSTTIPREINIGSASSQGEYGLRSPPPMPTSGQPFNYRYPAYPLTVAQRREFHAASQSRLPLEKPSDLKNASVETCKGSTNKKTASQGDNSQFVKTQPRRKKFTDVRQIIKRHKYNLRSPEDPFKLDPTGFPNASSKAVNEQGNDDPPLNIETVLKEINTSQQSVEEEYTSGELSSESEEEIGEPSSALFHKARKFASQSSYSRRKNKKKNKKYKKFKR